MPKKVWFDTYACIHTPCCYCTNWLNTEIASCIPQAQLLTPALAMITLKCEFIVEKYGIGFCKQIVCPKKNKKDCGVAQGKLSFAIRMVLLFRCVLFV